MGKDSIIDKLIITGVERPFTDQEQEAIEQELFGEGWAEHERLKAAGKLDELVLDFEEEEEFDLTYHEEEIEEDDPEVDEAIANALYGEETEPDNLNNLILPYGAKRPDK